MNLDEHGITEKRSARRAKDGCPIFPDSTTNVVVGMEGNVDIPCLQALHSTLMQSAKRSGNNCENRFDSWFSSAVHGLQCHNLTHHLSLLWGRCGVSSPSIQSDMSAFDSLSHPVMDVPVRCTSMKYLSDWVE